MKRSKPCNPDSKFSLSDLRRPVSPYHSSSDEDEIEAVPRRAGYCFGMSSLAESPQCLVRSLERNEHKRESATKDVLGVKSTEDGVEPIEVPEEALAELWNRVREISDKPAWELAMELDPTYAASDKIGMAFLRCVEGRAKDAARRLTRHFKTKLDLFGIEKLVKDIEISDLDEDDMEALYSGGFQVLPAKDRAGRPILFGRYTSMKYKEPKNMLRVLWYMWSSMVEDEAHQVSGVVAIGFENGKLPLERFDEGGSMFDMHVTDGGFDRDLAREILKIPLSVPIRPVGYHLCTDSTRWQSIFDMVLVTLCKFVRIRLRFHFGTEQETKYAMMTHGVPVDALPVTPSGYVDLTNHYHWIESRRELEEERQRSCM